MYSGHSLDLPRLEGNLSEPPQAYGPGTYVDIMPNLQCTIFHCIGENKPYELVYQVLELPPAMQRLVYDFGQLGPQTEERYIEQIVYSRVR